jgi:hypothetical protein
VALESVRMDCRASRSEPSLAVAAAAAFGGRQRVVVYIIPFTEYNDVMEKTQRMANAAYEAAARACLEHEAQAKAWWEENGAALRGGRETSGAVVGRRNVLRRSPERDHPPQRHSHTQMKRRELRFAPEATHEMADAWQRNIWSGIPISAYLAKRVK